MSVQDSNFYAQRVRKELNAKNHFDKVVHLHQQKKLADSFASGFSHVSKGSKASNSDILRNRTFANQMTVTNLNRSKPLYFLNTSNGLVPSNPNTLRDMGGVRNCEYHLDQEAELARNITWKEIAERDQLLSQMASSRASFMKSGSSKCRRSLDSFKNDE